MAHVEPTEKRPPSSRFGDLLKQWRQARRLSQEGLAAEAGVSTRHVSFLESGRAQPSREMVALLAHVLDLPLSERNLLYNAVGFLAPYQDQGLSTDDQGVRDVLTGMLRQQEPFPAIVVDGRWDVQMRNDAAHRFFGPLRARFCMQPELADNAMHAVFNARGLKPFISNWDVFAGEMLRILHREAIQGVQLAMSLFDEITRYPQLPAGWRDRTAPTASPITPMVLQMNDQRLSFITTFTMFAMPADAKLEQIKIESFFPADEYTAHFARRLAQGGATTT